MNEYLVRKLANNSRLIQKLAAGDEDKGKAKDEGKDTKEEKSFLGSRNAHRGMSAAAGALASFLASKYMLGVKDTPTLVGLSAAGGLGGLGLHEALAAPERTQDEQKKIDTTRQGEVSKAKYNIDNPSLQGGLTGTKGHSTAEKIVGTGAGAVAGHTAYRGGQELHKYLSGLKAGTSGTLADVGKRTVGQVYQDIAAPLTQAPSKTYADAVQGAKNAWKTPYKTGFLPPALDATLMIAGGIAGHKATGAAQEAATKWRYGATE